MSVRKSILFRMGKIIGKGVCNSMQIEFTNVFFIVQTFMENSICGIL